jgi:hypothetical protein
MLMVIVLAIGSRSMPPKAVPPSNERRKVTTHREKTSRVDVQP